MKIHVEVQSDFEYEVEDVVLIIEDDEEIRTCWVTGFDDVDLKNAKEYAKRLATTLNVEFIDE